MSIFNKQKAFTIAEVMIVLLILTIIFAACAPFITKRRISGTRSKNAVWTWASGNYAAGPMNAYYYSGDPDFTGEAFFGITPESKGAVTSLFSPISRVVIRSGGVTSNNVVQRQMQFRFGRNTTEDKGAFAGTVFLDGKNILLGGEYPLKNIQADKLEMAENIGIGYLSLSKIENATKNTALGAGALRNNKSGSQNTAIGYNAGANLTMSANNTYIGTNAGFRSIGFNNTAIGSNSGGAENTNTGLMVNNTLVGADSGSNLLTASNNIGIGYATLNKLTTGNYNTAIGYGALKSLTEGDYNVALGYNACSEMVKGSYKTCIGANSGPKKGSTADNFLGTAGSPTFQDKEIRTYIGGTPLGNFGGDAVLEIHNVAGTQKGLINYPSNNSNTTTIVNGNLVVRGRTFFTVGNVLYGFHIVKPSNSGTDRGIGSRSGDGWCAQDQRTYSFGRGCPNLTTSDRRLKNIGSKNIAGLDKINQLKIFNYSFINDKENKTQVGVMAQDLLEVFPNSVMKDNSGYYKIRWDEMFFASINAIKELDKKIVALVKRATKVETQIAKLEKENLLLKNEVEKLSLRVKKLKASN